jgi:hypothetical protein
MSCRKPKPRGHNTTLTKASLKVDLLRREGKTFRLTPIRSILFGEVV